MPRPSESIQLEYAVSLSRSWEDWFDNSIDTLQPPGAMREAIHASQLIDERPGQIWPGFMLPDSLPIIGNSYGDWLCVRANEHNEFGELIYWYHGGGDWVPVGTELSEALLHDAVDHFRPIRKQALRGATELEKTEDQALISRLSNHDFLNWLDTFLPDNGSGVSSAILKRVTAALTEKSYQSALECLNRIGWAFEASTCDLIEHSLQTPLMEISNAEFAEKHGYSWYPEYVAWMFDLQTIPADDTAAISNKIDFPWPQQDWKTAAQAATAIIEKRNDLGWAFTIKGWELERAGKLDEAAKVYQAGRFASSFADQAVRLNCHSLSERMGKFCIERLALLKDKERVRIDEDAYLQLFFGESEQSTLAQLHKFWWDQACSFKAEHNYARAYDCYMRSGWDMGVSRLSDYDNILNALVETAQLAGWHARAAVAKRHLDCLRR